MEALKSMYILSWVPFLGLMKKSRFVMPRSGKRMRAARTAFLICAVSAGPDGAMAENKTDLNEGRWSWADEGILTSPRSKVSHHRKVAKYIPEACLCHRS